jgi:hypothetical protein
MANPFNNTKFNSSPMESTKTNPRAKAPEGARSGVPSGKVRGVEHPIAEDAALIGDTRHELHSKALPKQYGPEKYGHYDSSSNLSGSDQLRADCGDGLSGEM